MLFKRALAPFLVRLSEWVYKGVCVDANEPFFIQMATGATDATLTADNWDSLFTVRLLHLRWCFWFDRCFSVQVKAEFVPSFLQPVAQSLLEAGKVVCVLRQAAPDHYLLRRRMRCVHVIQPKLA